MRLLSEASRKYDDNIFFWKHYCTYDGSKTGRQCVDKRTLDYNEKRRNIWIAWHNDPNQSKKLPTMPKAVVECEKCKYSDKTLGRFCGEASLSVINRSVSGTIPVPIRGKKKIWIDNVNQKMMNQIINDMSPDLEAFSISGSPGITDFSFLERFSKLRTVFLWWNNKVEKLWDFSKTPDVEYIYIDSFKRLLDISSLRDAKKLRYLSVSANVNSIKSLTNHSNLEYINLLGNVMDMDIRPLLNASSLKYLDCGYKTFPMEGLAMFESRRDDVDTNFFEGIITWNFENKSDEDYILLAGKQITKYKEKQKIQQHMEKFKSLKELYKIDDYVPVIKITSGNSPVEAWRKDLEDGIMIHKKDEIDEIEQILINYANQMKLASSKAYAKSILKKIINEIEEFNSKTEFIETEEKEEIYNFLSSLFKDKWYDDLEEILSEADW